MNDHTGETGSSGAAVPPARRSGARDRDAVPAPDEGGAVPAPRPAGATGARTGLRKAGDSPEGEGEPASDGADASVDAAAPAVDTPRTPELPPDEGSTTAVVSPPAGARLLSGRYRLGDVVGRGGMGTVWHATDEILARAVAVKELRLPPGVDDAERRRLVTRTHREAKAIAAIRSRGVVTVYDVVDDGSRPWIVMELIEGRSLAEVIREDGPMSPTRAAEIGLAVLDVLSAAHERGILHRDVKPSNVLVSEPDGRVVLTDFGIAKVEGDPSITSTGMLVGAPSYISPERARGENPGPAADLWSLGALLYCAVEGRPPYDRGGPIATLSAVMNDPLDPPRSAGPLEEVIVGLLTKDTTDRLDEDGARRALLAARKAASGEGSGGSETMTFGRAGTAAAHATAHPAGSDSGGTPASAGDTAKPPVDDPRAPARPSTAPSTGHAGSPSASTGHGNTGTGDRTSALAEGGPARPDDAERRRRLMLGAAILLLLAVLAAILIIVLPRGDDTDGAAGSGSPDTSEEADTAPGDEGADPEGRAGEDEEADAGTDPAPGDTDPDTDAPDTTESDGPADSDEDGGDAGEAPATSDPGGDGAEGDGAEGDVPDGFTVITNERYRFSLALPDGWAQTGTAGRDSGAIHSAPGGGPPKVQVDFTPTPQANAESSWRVLEPAVRGSSPGYEHIDIGSVEWRGYPTVADWQFVRNEGGQRVRILNRGFRVDDNRGYAIMITCAETGWDDEECRTIRDTALATFRPLD
ncbi:protein kinase [Streptomyces sp. ST2-7A]|uniref:protein kinase domain-containing protein n=1 Tax=Streptomyces sp. ST2-7A TaxID=2907214 RepID=UPI001F29E116|nr:protein kinase [Streptomyces sp. ST2-7A]MCE7078746.1 protein kinase [Streptomyces sp. ST2-7A]